MKTFIYNNELIKLESEKFDAVTQRNEINVLVYSFEKIDGSDGSPIYSIYSKPLTISGAEDTDVLFSLYPAIVDKDKVEMSSSTEDTVSQIEASWDSEKFRYDTSLGKEDCIKEFGITEDDLDRLVS